MALVIVGLESGVTLLTSLLDKFISKHKKKEVPDECRFIVLYTLLSHYDLLRESLQRFDYIDILLENVNERFPHTKKPKKSLIPYIRDRCDKEYQPTILHYACKFADIDLIHFILQKDTLAIATLNKKNYEGKTPLMLLCEHLFKNHVVPRYLYHDHYVSDLEKLKILLNITTKFISKNADLSLCDSQENSILHYLFLYFFNKPLFATEEEYEPMVAMLSTLCDLFEKSSPGLINKFNNEGNTPFHIFIQNIHKRNFPTPSLLKVINYFIKQKIDLCSINHQGETALQMYLAASLNIEYHDNILWFLIGQGSPIYWPHQKIPSCSSDKKITCTQKPIELILSFLKGNYNEFLSHFTIQRLIYSHSSERIPFWIFLPHNGRCLFFHDYNETFLNYLKTTDHNKKKRANFFMELFIEQQIQNNKPEWEKLLGSITIDTETFKRKKLLPSTQKIIPHTEETKDTEKQPFTPPEILIPIETNNAYLSFKALSKRYIFIFLKWLNLPFFFHC